jgi:hypothetical protein
LRILSVFLALTQDVKFEKEGVWVFTSEAMEVHQSRDCHREEYSSLVLVRESSQWEIQRCKLCHLHFHSPCGSTTICRDLANMTWNLDVYKNYSLVVEGLLVVSQDVLQHSFSLGWGYQEVG